MSPTFAEQFTFAEARSSGIDTAAIRGMIPGCVRVLRATQAQDKCGVDYFAELESGVKLGIDAKTRRADCSRYWRVRHGRREPDLQLETWSVIPTDGSQGKIGWTLDQAKLTDLVLFTYDASDCDRCYLLGFHHLRTAFVSRRGEWEKRWHAKPQKTYDRNGRLLWRSECMFVPVTVVFRAIQGVSVGHPSALMPGDQAA